MKVGDSGSLLRVACFGLLVPGYSYWLRISQWQVGYSGLQVLLLLYAVPGFGFVGLRCGSWYRCWIVGMS